MGRRALPLEVAWKSHRGMIRERNEDYCMVPEVEYSLLCQRGYLFAVADGMGGYGDGHKASQVSLQTLYEAYYGAETSSLPDAIQHANMAVRRLAMQPENDARLGTTLVAALFRERSILVAHVGDSRAYIVRGRSIWQVTQDHSAQQEQLRVNHPSDPHAQKLPGKNVVTRAIGQREIVPADYTPVTELVRGDVLVLCSDGLSNLVADGEIVQSLAAHPLRQAADLLVELANHRGGHDNITIQIIRINALPFCPRPSTTQLIPGRLRVSNRTLSLLGGLLLIIIVLGAVLFIGL